MDSAMSNETLIAKYKETGDIKIRNEVIVNNIPLVKFVIQRYFPKIPISKFADVENEGIIGLIKAVEKYSPERGKFSTCATWYIRGEIYRALEKPFGITRQVTGNL